MPPGPEGLMNGQQFLIMGIIVELQSGQGPRVVHDGANLFIQTTDGEDASDGIV